jgi:hypothetical protein
MGGWLLASERKGVTAGHSVGWGAGWRKGDSGGQVRADADECG